MKQQKGMTFIGMLFTAIFVIMVGIFIIRTVPVYIKYNTIVQAVKNLNLTAQKSLSDDASANAEVLKSNFLKSLEVNGIYDFKESDISISPKGDNKYQVQLKYKEVKHLMFNVSLMFDFNKTQEVIISGEN